MTVVGSVRAATAALSLPICSSLVIRPASWTLNFRGTKLSSISMPDTPTASNSRTVRMTLTALPNPSSASTIRLTSAIRVMRWQWSTTSDMLVSTPSGTPKFATFPTEPERTQTSYSSMWAMRADSGSKMFAAKVQVPFASTCRNFSRATDMTATSFLLGSVLDSLNHTLRRAFSGAGISVVWLVREATAGPYRSA